MCLTINRFMSTSLQIILHMRQLSSKTILYYHIEVKKFQKCRKVQKLRQLFESCQEGLPKGPAELEKEKGRKPEGKGSDVLLKMILAPGPRPDLVLSGSWRISAKSSWTTPTRIMLFVARVCMRAYYPFQMTSLISANCESFYKAVNNSSQRMPFF